MVSMPPLLDVGQLIISDVYECVHLVIPISHRWRLQGLCVESVRINAERVQ